MGLVKKDRDHPILQVSMLGSKDANEPGPGSGRIGLHVVEGTSDRERIRCGRHAVSYRNAAPNRRAFAPKGAHRLRWGRTWRPRSVGVRSDSIIDAVTNLAGGCERWRESWVHREDVLF